TAALDERLPGGALRGRHEVAHRAADQPFDPALEAVVRRDDQPRAGAVDGDDRVELVRWPREIELELAVLVDGADGVDGRRALAVLAEAFGPEPPVPGPDRRAR